MKTGAVKLEPVDSSEHLAVLENNQTEPLRECVRNALRFYLHHLGDHDVDDLHDMVMREVEHPMIETVLQHTQGNQTRAASMLGMSRSTLRKKIAHYGIRRNT